jgi:hypothetical protein
VPGPTWVVEHGARERHEIGFAAGDDIFGLLCLGDKPDSDRIRGSGFFDLF